MRYEFDWSILARPELTALLIAGVGYTLVVAAVSTGVSLVLGTGLAIARVSGSGWLRWPAELWVNLARHIPGVFWVLFFYFAFPELLPETWGSALNGWAYFALAAGIVALSVDNATYVSDIVRTGALAIPRGEWEAARCCGLSPWQQWTCCLIPVTLRTVTPPLANRTIHNFKNSSLCMVIAVPELTWATQQIESLTFRGIEATLVATLFYVTVALALGVWARRLEGGGYRHWRGAGAVWRHERGELAREGSRP